MAPSDSRAALKLMESLVASGDPAGALAHHRVHQVLLREEGLEPDATHAEFAAALRTRGTQSTAASARVSPSMVASAGFREGTSAQPLSDGSLRGEPAKIAGHGVAASRRGGLIAAAVVVLALITAALGWRAKGTGEMSQVSLLLPDQLELHSSGAALSPDGKTVVYAAVAEGSTASPPRLYVHRLGELQARLLKKTEGASYPFFSPDGGSVGFTVGDGIKTIALGDGSIASVADNLGLGGAGVADASWSDDGYILFGSNMDRQRIGIRRVSAKGGSVEVLSRPESSRSEAAHYAPQRLPGTETLIYTVRSSDARGITYRAVARELGSGRSHDLIEGAILARYIDGGWLAYQIGSDVFVSRFDVRALVLSSERRRVVDGVFFWLRGRAWTANADVFIYQPDAATKGMLVWVSRDGTHRDTLPMPPDNYEGPNISPSGDRIALLVRTDGLTDAWTYDLRRSVLTKVSSDGITGNARWTPDGTRLTYRRRSRTGLDLYTRAADGTGSPELLFGNGGVLWPADWTRDMRTLVVNQHDTVTNGGDLWTLDLASKTLRPLVRTPAAEFGGRLSPDGRWLAYASDVSGRWELYVTSFPGANRRWQVSQHGGREAMWSKDGRELIFRNGKAVMVAAVRPGATFDWEPPRVLFEGNFWQGGGAGAANYDVSSDGKRFLMIQEPARGTPRLNVIHEWQRLGIESVVPNR